MILSPASFATIVGYILREGDRQTYCNMYNHNPHVTVAGFDAFLHPDIGQRNINCDPERSGFDEIVFRSETGERIEYARIKLTRTDALEFEPADRHLLEYYFAALIEHISAAG